MAKKDEETRAVVAQPSSYVPAEFGDDLAQYAGAGVSERQEDFLIPFIGIAQSNSPQLKKQQADKFIPGLEAGDMFNTATREIYRADEGVLVVPAFFQKALVEWVLRDEGGGYVATHAIDAPIRKTARLGGEGNRFLLLPNGHQLVDTSYHFCTLAETAQSVVVAMTSTGLAVSRMWQTIMKEVKIPTAGGLVVAPSFSRVYRLRTVYKKNDAGDWFNWAVTDEGWAVPTHKMAYEESKKTFVHCSTEGVQMGRPPDTEQAQPDPAPVNMDEVPI